MTRPAEHIATVGGAILILWTIERGNSTHSLLWYLSMGSRIVSHCEVIIIIYITRLAVSQLSDSLLGGILLRMSAEARIRSLILHKVLCLNNDEVGQEGREEYWKYRGDNKREIVEDLSHEWIRLNYGRDHTGLSSDVKSLLINDKIRVEDCHDYAQNDIDIF